MTELKPCPFCGGEVITIETFPGRGEIYCGDCDVVMAGDNAKTLEELTEAWNTRAERTCEFTVKDNMNESEGMGDVWIECSACHCQFDYYADEWLMKMHYCPNCGAKVIGG